MDIEKEKTDPENSSGNDNTNIDENQESHQDLDDQDPSKKKETENAPQDENAESSGGGQSEAAENSEMDEQAMEEQPPPLPPDLPKVSQEVDQYISSLTSSSKQDESSKPPPAETVPIFVEQFAVLVEVKMEEYNSAENHVKWTRLTDEDSDSFLETIDRVSKLYEMLCEYSSDYQFAYSINRIGSVHQRAMAYLEEEFRSLMEDYKIPDSEYQDNTTTTTTATATATSGDQDHGEPQENPGSENDHPTKESEHSLEIGYSNEGISDLRKLSKAMIAGGYETECCQVYFVTRRNALEETLYKFGLEKHSIDDVQKMNWESLEREITAWINTFKHYTTSELPRERKLSDSVFPDHPRISEAIFCSLSRGIVAHLINFSEAVAMSKRAAEKLFKFLDMYETLRDILPTIDNLLPAESGDEIKSEAMLTRTRLGEAMVCIFCELENSIKADTGKTPIPGGAVHPLTRYTINYLTYACEYKDTLEQVFREHQKIERADSGTVSDFDYNSQNQNSSGSNNNNNNNNQKVEQSPVQAQLVKVMDLLDANLEGKSKLYKDLSLSSIFMMNNGRYILQKVRGSAEISGLMGNSWCRKRSSDLRQYHKNYQRETWGKLLNCLINHEGLNVNGKVVKPVLKERFKSFNAMFDEIHRTQSGWVVSDEQLQSELRVSISNMVIPAYRAFMARYSQTLTPGRQTEKYVKYQPEDIESYVDELFDGNAAPAGRRKQ